MTAAQLVQDLSWATYVTIFVIVAAKAMRSPRRVNIDIALFFSLPMLIVVFTLLAPPAGSLLSYLVVILLLALPYMLIRLVDDFADVPKWLLYTSEVLLALIVVGTVALGSKQPDWFVTIELFYLIVFLAYGVVGFARQSQRTRGVTRRRMRSAAAGSIALCLVFVFSGLARAAPQFAGLWSTLSQLSSLASGVSYFLGFTPPEILRRAWQEPELRAFLGRAARLPRLPDTQAILAEMESGAAASLGAPHASVGLWSEARQALSFGAGDEQVDVAPTPLSAVGRAFLNQKPVFTADAPRDNPAVADALRKYGATALLVAPITAGGRKLGVLTVYAPQAPIFAEDDLALVQLLADQAAVILESRALIDEATHVRAQEEVTRLKEDFLSAAAHDLRTPLTTLVAQAQLLERRAVRSPEAPADLAGIQKVEKEAQRLKTLVLELLDATRTEQGRLVGTREEVDLTEVAEETCARNGTDLHPCEVEAEGPVLGCYDSVRIRQLVENLVENAVKYSPEAGAVRVKVWREKDCNCLSVADSGIGIPAEDLSHIFDRFHRGTNVDDKRFMGMGLGLFICKGIVEQHGGRIWVDSVHGRGSTFYVALPVEVGKIDADVT